MSPHAFSDDAAAHATARAVSRLALGSLVAIAAWLASASSARAVTCGSVFSCSGTTCSLSSLASFTGDTTIDCTGSNLTVAQPNGRITVQNGTLYLLASHLTVQEGQSIEATTNQANTDFGVDLSLDGQLTLDGYLTANGGSGGGTIDVVASDYIHVNAGAGVRGVQAKGTSSGADGGSITLDSATAIVIDDPVTADGAQTGTTEGGLIRLDTPSITITDSVTAGGTGAPGGSITLSALSSPGTVTISGQMKAEGSGAGGDGGSIEIDAVGQVTTSAVLSTQGGVGAGGGWSHGGSVLIHSRSSGVTIGSTINTSSGGAGPADAGGGIVVEAKGAVSVAGGISLLAQSDANGGDGSPILIRTASTLTIGASTLDSRGDWANSAKGAGGPITLGGCTTTIASGAVLDARGYDGGQIRIEGNAAVSIGSGSGTAIDVRGQTGGEAGETVLAYGVSGRCTANQLLACAVCRGTCSNQSDLECASDPDCTVGCNTGTCQSKVCTEEPANSCTTDSQCDTCGGSGPCVANPDTGGSVMQFYPVAPTRALDRRLPTCN